MEVGVGADKPKTLLCTIVQTSHKKWKGNACRFTHESSRVFLFSLTWSLQEFQKWATVWMCNMDMRRKKEFIPIKKNGYETEPQKTAYVDHGRYRPICFLPHPKLLKSLQDKLTLSHEPIGWHFPDNRRRGGCWQFCRSPQGWQFRTDLRRRTKESNYFALLTD